MTLCGHFVPILEAQNLVLAISRVAFLVSKTQAADEKVRKGEVEYESSC